MTDFSQNTIEKAEQSETDFAGAFEELSMSYAFDSGLKEGFEQGVEQAFEAMFESVYDCKSAVECAEQFIREFNEKFPKFSILQARIGINPSSMEPTAFFVTNIPDDMEDEVMDLQRGVESSFFEKNNATICIWSTSSEGLCEDTMKVDFPFIRKAIAK